MYSGVTSRTVAHTRNSVSVSASLFKYIEDFAVGHCDPFSFQDVSQELNGLSLIHGQVRWRVAFKMKAMNSVLKKGGVKREQGGAFLTYSGLLAGQFSSSLLVG